MTDADERRWDDPDRWVRDGGYVCIHGYRVLVPADCVRPDCPPRAPEEPHDHT